MYLKLVKKAFKEFLDVDGVDYAIMDTDSYGDCTSCVNYNLIKMFGEDSRGIFLRHWKKGMNAQPSLTELDELYISHYITEEQGEKLYNILSKYFVVSPEKYDSSKTYVIKSKTNTLEERIKELVETEYSDMKLTKKYSNRARLSNKCQEVVSKEWSSSSDGIWKLIDEYIEKIIPEHLD